jgi:hypothetical protein
MRRAPEDAVMIQLSQQASDDGRNQQTGPPTPLLPDAEIDLTDGIAPSDFPILVLLRKRVRQLRAENDDLRQQVEAWRRRPDELICAFAGERDRAKHAEVENKHLLKRVRKLEAELAKLRPKDLKREQSKENSGLFRRVLRNRRKPGTQAN